MKIAIIGTRGIPNNYGGFEQFAECLSVGLVDKGHDLFVYNSHNHIFKDNIYKGVKIIHCFDPEYLIGTSGQFIYDLNCILNTRKHDFDIILQLGYTSSSIWNFLFLRKPKVITNMDGIEWKRSKFSGLAKYYLFIAERLCVKYSDAFISDSIGIQSYLKRTFNISSTYIAYGAANMGLPNLDALEEYDLKKHQYDIIIARLEPENNIEMILEGFMNSNMDRDLVVIGSLETSFGKYISKKYNDSRIKYLGFVSCNDNLNSLRYFSNLYFHGHSVGGTNPSLLEAMASCALICAHDNIFNYSILENDGYYFTNSKQISVLIDNNIKDLDSQMLKNNHEKIKKLYSWNKIIDKYNSVFHRIINN